MYCAIQLFATYLPRSLRDDSRLHLACCCVLPHYLIIQTNTRPKQKQMQNASSLFSILFHILFSLTTRTVLSSSIDPATSHPADAVISIVIVLPTFVSNICRGRRSD
ncbi:hypothetical protein F5Y05DRAFT_196686 [Hypoxylon sp. FL0543]|nr:hypothetical protein F5Y05DRAFT_196686 [Hypoxylon sp. FL0543]